MLKRLFSLIIVLVLSLFITNNLVYSQEPPQEDTDPSMDQIIEDYARALEEYNITHDEYVLKRVQYLKFLSLKSKQDAYDATLAMLEKRDEVVISYLKVLRKKIDEGIGISEARKEGLYFRIDEEISWYENHRENLSTTGSLDDLVDDSTWLPRGGALWIIWPKRQCLFWLKGKWRILMSGWMKFSQEQKIN